MEITSQSNSIINYLSEDTLRQIFSHIDLFDLNSTSLVCKLFCSLSSAFVHELTQKDSTTCSDFQTLFKRFPCVTKIRMEFRPRLDNALLAISNSDLNLEKLELPLPLVGVKRPYFPEPQTIFKLSTSKVFKRIKSLQLSWYPGQPDCQVIEFKNLFPSITELNISNKFRLKDKLVHKITLNLPNLRKISISCHNRLTDNALDILSSNCPKLESVNFQMCSDFTPEAIYKFFCNNLQLSSVHMPIYYFYMLPLFPRVIKCMQVLPNLNHLTLVGRMVQDGVLEALAESQPRLKSLVICDALSQEYTMTGLSRLLFTCPELESLEVDLPSVENCSTHDAKMSIVVKRLPNLKHITVRSRIVCQATLFSLVQNCPLLETVRLRSDSKCRAKQVSDQGMIRPSKKNYSLKSIYVDSESDNWLLSAVEPYCPNLRK
ncbi:hypothetical protein QQ045_012048 [Rhodiola kirilowii]